MWSLLTYVFIFVGTAVAIGYCQIMYHALFKHEVPKSYVVNLDAGQKANIKNGMDDFGTIITQLPKYAYLLAVSTIFTVILLVTPFIWVLTPKTDLKMTYHAFKGEWVKL